MNESNHQGLSQLYMNHYPDKYNKGTVSTALNNHTTNTVGFMLALVSSSSFPVPISLVKRLGSSSSSLSAMLDQIFTGQRCHWQVAHDTFEDWKWWNKITKDHTDIQHATHVLVKVSKKWQSMQGVERSFAAKYWLRHLIQEERTVEAKALLLNPQWLMSRAADPEGIIEECEEDLFEDDSTIVLLGEAVALGSKEDSRGRDGNLSQDIRRLPAVLIGHLLGWATTNPEIQQLLQQLKDTDHGFSWWCPTSPTMVQAGTSRTHDSSSSSSCVIPSHSGIVRSIVFSNDGQCVASCSADRTIRIWNTSTGLTTHVLKGHEDEVYTIAFSSDGKTLVSGGGNNDPTVRIWTLKECGNKVVEQEQEQEQGTATVEDNGILALVEQEQEQEQGTATVEDNGILALPEHDPPQTTQAMYSMVVLKGHRKWVRAVDFSPDGALAVSASGDHTVRVWDLATEKTRHECIGHTNEVFATSFSSDGLYVLSGSKDETICVWCVTTGALLHTLDCTNHELISVRFSSQHSQGKGFRIVAEGWDKTVRVWELNATQYTCVYVSLPEHPLPLSYVEDVKNQSIFDRAINLKAVVKADAPVGLNVGGVYARSHIDGKTAVAQDFERLHFLQFIPSPMALQQQERSTQGAQ